MRKGDEGNWLDDAFDDRKNAEELQRAKSSKGPLIGLIVLLAVAILFVAGIAFFIWAASVL